MTKEIQINEDRFYDILFDNTKSVVEKRSEKSNFHLTSLIVDGVLKAWREITSEGIIYMEIK
ncbi:cef modifier of supressor tRNAs [Cronobacter phage S13]|jgi:hypothetical protein|uniref:Uncharacterized protein n=1 Tax=Cronobacter phage LPCS28 TaxID=2924885 RepID=A0AAE9GB41_9CAUD|nr:cef modifier of supressor tRNAs [Cronobacter phage S13]YP_010665838.1 hypothetical protein PQB73_gp186 [Cronobacter phage LPCS28]AIA65055.1 hypothetical protein S13_258 [Cronobacter phage S13]UNY47027.1 hypothetical protein EHEKIMEA_00145 [Cronobacter phage LPCS28]